MAFQIGPVTLCGGIPIRHFLEFVFLHNFAKKPDLFTLRRFSVEVFADVIGGSARRSLARVVRKQPYADACALDFARRIALAEPEKPALA
jgi:hypothetical protein